MQPGIVGANWMECHLEGLSKCAEGNLMDRRGRLVWHAIRGPYHTTSEQGIPHARGLRQIFV